MKYAIIALVFIVACSRYGSAQEGEVFADVDDLVKRLRALEYVEYTTNYKYDISMTKTKDGVISSRESHVVHNDGSVNYTGTQFDKKTNKAQTLAYTRTPEIQFVVSSKDTSITNESNNKLLTFSEMTREKIVNAEKGKVAIFYYDIMPLTSCPLHLSDVLLSDYIERSKCRLLSQSRVDNNIHVKFVSDDSSFDIVFHSIKYPIALNVIATKNNGSYKGTGSRIIEKSQHDGFICKSMQGTYYAKLGFESESSYIRNYTNYEFTTIPETEFTLEKYGIRNPEGLDSDKPTPFWVWIAIGAGVLAVVAIAFRLLQRRALRQAAS